MNPVDQAIIEAREHVAFMKAEGINPYDTIKAIQGDLWGPGALPDWWGTAQLFIALWELKYGTGIDREKLNSIALQRRVNDAGLRSIG